jgi:cytochrome P450 family 2 subfamily J/cytochrome P450 family 2 subfamily U polypeptide 1
MTLRWIMLFMANHPDMQRRMRKEIEENIGDRMPVQDDKLNCHFTNAFITECMRYRIISPFVLPHKAICDVTIGRLNFSNICLLII